jgi:hypothetical protein
MFMALSKSCTIANTISIDGRRASTYDDPQTVDCNYQLAEELDTEGNNIIVSGWLMLPAGTSIYPDSLISIDGRSPSIKSIKDVSNLLTGEVQGIKIELGKGI